MNRNNVKSLAIIIATIILFPILFMQGCKGLARTMYRSMDCDQFNIDHIELRTGINVPKVERNSCTLEDYVRLVSFQLLEDDEFREGYIADYFEWADSLFYASNAGRHTQWSATLDTTTNELTFRLRYTSYEY